MARIRDREEDGFDYWDKGNVVTIGLARAVADIKLPAAERVPACLMGWSSGTCST